MSADHAKLLKDLRIKLAVQDAMARDKNIKRSADESLHGFVAERFRLSPDGTELVTDSGLSVDTFVRTLRATKAYCFEDAAPAKGSEELSGLSPEDKIRAGNARSRADELAGWK